MQIALRRSGGYAAIATPILMWLGFFAAATTRPGYDLLSRPFSDLATRGTQNATLFDIGFFIAPGVLTALVGVGVWHAGHGSAWRAGALMVAMTGLFLVATGLFPQDPSSPTASILHGTVSQICFAIASIAPIVLLAASFRDPRLDPPRRVWLITGVMTAVLEGVAVLLRPVIHYPDGLFQRPFTVALTVWFVATGAWLLRVRKAEGQLFAE